MSKDQTSRSGDDERLEHRLVFAVCHEVGNWITAVRLQANLLDESLDARELALASLEIDEMCARTSAILSLLRPLLSQPGQVRFASSAESILAALDHGLIDLAGRGASLEVEPARCAGRALVEPEALQSVLVTYALGALDAVRPDGFVRIGVETTPDELRVVVTDDACEPELESWRDEALRGRVLACALADAVLLRWSGRLEVSCEANTTRAAFCLPLAP